MVAVEEVIKLASESVTKTAVTIIGEHGAQIGKAKFAEEIARKLGE